ncbi:hypothetical protein V1477_010581 [Vespula maculifrons]|uniref:Uncharacterized protein n=1 Tax=Vespula maculifrons TaxID=7453 RepID=A0ABD2C2C5_VESMC
MNPDQSLDRVPVFDRTGNSMLSIDDSSVSGEESARSGCQNASASTMFMEADFPNFHFLPFELLLMPVATAHSLFITE